MEKVSIIIPAYNEEGIIQKTVESYKLQQYPLLEIIVVVNNSNDKTYEIAERYADKVLNLGAIGVSVARNEGAKVAAGSILIFSDADSIISPGGVEKIANVVREGMIGTILGRGDVKGFKGRLFFFYKNTVHKLRIHKGIIDGVFFCHKKIFLETGGFNPAKKITEFDDFIFRARKIGARYKLITNCYAITSLRRYEEKGYLKMCIFWIKYKSLSLVGREGKIASDYFKR
ncbi:MAG: glycosyltransferase [Candidatus Staskawiczbacteria bacterium]|jgi:glycosyltransferase involved in cell wall biosynthesis